jgi:Arc/MetJ-type ribon-helix-helix transcriptional regulator
MRQSLAPLSLLCAPKTPSVIMKPKRRAILVRLPESLVDRLNALVYDLRMCSRSDYIGRSLERALGFSEGHEVPLLDNEKRQRS